jgi:hypothetical protein
MVVAIPTATPPHPTPPHPTPPHPHRVALHFGLRLLPYTAVGAGAVAGPVLLHGVLHAARWQGPCEGHAWGVDHPPSPPPHTIALSGGGHAPRPPRRRGGGGLCGGAHPAERIEGDAGVHTWGAGQHVGIPGARRFLLSFFVSCVQLFLRCMSKKRIGLQLAMLLALPPQHHASPHPHVQSNVPSWHMMPLWTKAPPPQTPPCAGAPDV